MAKLEAVQKPARKCKTSRLREILLACGKADCLCGYYWCNSLSCVSSVEDISVVWLTGKTVQITYGLSTYWAMMKGRKKKRIIQQRRFFSDSEVA